MRLNNFNEIATFVCVVNAGSFTGAAAQLDLTRSAVGKSIARLEQRLKVRLLNRTPRSLSLTDDGRAFFARCVQILGDLEETEDAMAQRSVAPQGRLRISLPIALGHRHVLDVIREYVETWPGVSADVSFSDRFIDLIDEGFDIALRIGGSRADSGLITRVVAHERLVLCASPAYLARRGTPAAVADLKEHECLFFVNGSRVVPWLFRDDTQFRGDGRMHLNSAEAIRELAVAGFGIARLPTYLTEPDLRAGRLLPLLREQEREADPIRVVYPTRQHLSPKVRLFIDLLARRWSRRAPGQTGPSKGN